ncbi:hypothetical protein Bca4012_059449 [Brassica carinata]
MKIYLVSSTDSPEFTRLKCSFARSTVIALDAEWKPQRSVSSSFPIVTLLQVACRLGQDSDDVFLIDLTSIHLPSVWELLNDMFVSPDVLKLGFRFKQDLVYLSSTFTQHGCEGRFNEVKQYMDITSIYNHLLHKRFGRKAPKDIKSLAAICKELLDISLSKESDLLPRVSKKKTRRRGASLKNVNTDKHTVCSVDWQGPPPWDSSLGGDGCPKFLLDVMVEGLAKHLRCVGIDAAVPPSKKPDSRELLDQALKENRVLLTRDTKLLRHQDLAKHQIYRVKSLLKNEQLLEVIETFQLKISESQLMSRCTKCNGKFIQKPLTIEEAIEAAKGFQRIPNCLFNKNLEFWQCMNCHQLYWEGTQYHNAVQKFMDVCKLSE